MNESNKMATLKFSSSSNEDDDYVTVYTKYKL